MTHHKQPAEREQNFHCKKFWKISVALWENPASVSQSINQQSMRRYYSSVVSGNPRAGGLTLLELIFRQPPPAPNECPELPDVSDVTCHGERSVMSSPSHAVVVASWDFDDLWLAPPLLPTTRISGEICSAFWKTSDVEFLLALRWWPLPPLQPSMLVDEVFKFLLEPPPWLKTVSWWHAQTVCMHLVT